MSIAEHALSYVADGQVLGLGTGRAATEFVQALGQRVRAGLRVRGVPTSKATADLAAKLGIPLTTLADVQELDVAIDGADEVDAQLRLIKGNGGALVREKIVAASARRFVVLVGEDKEVPVLGAHGNLPVEVVPFGVHLVQRRLQTMGYASRVRQQQGQPLPLVRSQQSRRRLAQSRQYQQPWWQVFRCSRGLAQSSRKRCKTRRPA